MKMNIPQALKAIILKNGGQVVLSSKALDSAKKYQLRVRGSQEPDKIILEIK